MDQAPLPYGRQWIDEDDIRAVVETLRGDWLTTGPRVEQFEQAFARRVGAKHAVAVSSGTAALHAAMSALRIGPGDEVIVPPLTFAATANCVLYQGATPVFADVEPDTLLIDPEQVKRKITSKTKAIIAVDYAGQPCDYDRLRGLCWRHGLSLVADACHALGGERNGRKVGTLADLNTFSLHPVKPIAAGEGGVVSTDDAEMARRLRSFRNHGIDTTARERAAEGGWRYDMTELGYNYRLSDIHCALAHSQLRKLTGWVERRQSIAARYDELLASLPGIQPLAVRGEASHAYHLYVVQAFAPAPSRETVFKRMRAAGIGVNVHYIPVHLHPYYRQRLGTGPGLCPVAEAAAERILSLPLFPKMTDSDVDRVVEALRAAAMPAMSSAAIRPVHSPRRTAA
jgi:perosamine synthetase